MILALDVVSRDRALELTEKLGEYFDAIRSAIPSSSMPAWG